MATLLDSETDKQVENRARISTALGDPFQRRLGRIRLGMTQRDLAEATGLSEAAIRLRETRGLVRGSRADLAAEARYAEIIARAFGRKL